MSISLLSTFAGDGEQSDVTVEKINEIIDAVNSGGGGGGGGGASFPMAEGVWYDASYGKSYEIEPDYVIGADFLDGGVILIPATCTISKVGILPTAAPDNPASVLVGLYAIGDDGLPAAQVGATATVAVSDSWTEGIQEAATAIEVTAGWYYISAASDESVSLAGFQTGGVAAGIAGFSEADGYLVGFGVDSTGIHSALPATLVGSEDVIRIPGAAQILFQITHPA